MEFTNLEKLCTTTQECSWIINMLDDLHGANYIKGARTFTGKKIFDGGMLIRKFAFSFMVYGGESLR